MKLQHLSRTAGLSALAAAIAFAAIPAQASARDNNDRGGWSGGSHGNAQQSVSSQGKSEARSDARPSGPSRGEGGPAPQRAWAQRQAPASIPQTSVPASTTRYQPSAAHQPNVGAGRYGGAPGAAGRQPGRDWNGSNHQVTQDTTRGRTYTGPQRGTGSDANRTNANRTVADRTTDRYSGGHGNNGGRYNNGHGNGNYNGHGNGNYNGHGNGNYNGHGNGNHNQWNHDWRNDHRYDWHGYRNSHRSVFHLGYYYSPYRSWSYRPLSIGFYLEPLFYSNRYWIDDPYQYRLPDAYGEYRWVRYYNDALLVDIYSGEVVDVIPNFFW